MSAKSALLRHRGFRSYFLARSISQFGTSFGLLALTFAVLQSGHSPFHLGLILAAGSIPPLLLLLLGGVVGDRWDRRLILASSDVTMALTQCLTALVLTVGDGSVWLLCSLQAIRGTASAFFNPAATGMIPSLLGRDDTQKGNALLGIGSNFAGIVGPAVAGVVMVLWSAEAALFLDAATYLASAAFLLGVPRTSPPSSQSSLLESLREGWAEFRSRGWAWRMVCSFAVYSASVVPAIYLAGPLLAENGGVGASGWAWVLSARAAGSFLAGFLLLRWRPSRPLVAGLLLAQCDVGLLLVIAAQGPLEALVVMGFASAAGITLSATLWDTTLQREVPSHVLSRVSSYDWLGSSSMLPVGNIVMGAALTLVDPSALVYMVLISHVVISTGLIASRPIRAVRDIPTHTSTAGPDR